MISVRILGVKYMSRREGATYAVPALHRRPAVYTNMCHVAMPTSTVFARRVLSNNHLLSASLTRCTDLSMYPQPVGETHVTEFCSGGNLVSSICRYEANVRYGLDAPKLERTSSSDWVLSTMRGIDTY